MTATGPLTLAVDAERLVSAFLRAQPEIAALVDGRVYTALPPTPVLPVLRLTRIAGTPLGDGAPFWADLATLQCDAWANGKPAAWTLAETTRAVLAARLAGAHSEGVVSSVTFAQFAYVPDADYSPARPRYLFDLDVVTRPAPVVAGA